MPKISVIRDKIVDEYEIVKILKACRNDRKLLFAVAIAWETGARISELIQLRAKDFSEEGNYWVVSIPTLKQRTLIHGRAPKRNLFIKRDNIYERVIKPILLLQKDSEKPIVLPNSKNTLENKIKRRYPDVYFHWLRHSRCSIWARTFDIFTLQKSMGWRDIRMANIYVHQESLGKKMKELQK
jgi:integrase